MGQVLAFPIFILAISVDSTYLALFLTSCAAVPQGLVGPSQNTAQMSVVPQELRATTTGMAEVCWTGANAVGPLVGGILSDVLGDRTKTALGKQYERPQRQSVILVKLLMVLVRAWCSSTEHDHSGLVKMLWIGALIPLGQAGVAWRWRFSVRDHMRAQNGSLSGGKGESNTSAPTHIVIADYTPSFERALQASKDDQVTRVPQSTETSDVRAK